MSLYGLPIYNTFIVIMINDFCSYNTVISANSVLNNIFKNIIYQYIMMVFLQVKNIINIIIYNQ